MKTILTMISAGLLFITTSCNKSSMQDVKPVDDNTTTAARGGFPETFPRVIMSTQSAIYYNNKTYKVALKTNAPSPYIHHVLVNSLYVIREPLLPGAFSPRFIPIVNALPTINFDASTVWEVVYLTFSDVGMRPFQLQSQQDVNKVISSGLVTVTKTNAFLELALSKDQPVAIQ
jgi:hypothetical protein